MTSPGLAAVVKEVEKDPNTSRSKHNFIELMNTISTREPERHHIKATPLFELSTVSIHTGAFKDLLVHGPRIELYGHVKLIDDNQTEFYLFDLAADDAKGVDLVGSPSIILRGSEHGRPHWLPKFFNLDLCLRDKIRDIVIVEKVYYLNFAGKVDYEKEVVLEYCFEGCLLANLTYRVFSYGVIASIDCTLLRNDKNDNDSVGSDDLHDVVNGTIASTCMGRNRPISRILLFDQLSVHMCRTSWLAVPAYSPVLKIEANLKVDGQDYNTGDPVEFKVYDKTSSPYRRDILVGRWIIRVRVSWRHPFYFLDGGYLRECDYDSEVEKASLEEGKEENEKEFFEMQKRMFDMNRYSVFLGPPCQPDASLFFLRFGPSESPPSIERIDLLYLVSPLHLVEVFSIAVFTYDDDDDDSLSLHGTIKVHDAIGSSDMFNSKRMDSALVHPGDVLCVIESLRCFMGNNFGMDFDLSDSQGREISKGYLRWDYYTVSGWHDRRICSIVPGKDGFAAVHYTLFENAVQARVKVVIISDFIGPNILVGGRICSRYTDYRYFTSYEKRYYESILFESDMQVLYTGQGFEHEVPLSKSIVCVPLDVSLIVKVDLFLMFVPIYYTEELREKFYFKAEDPKELKIQSPPQILQGGAFDISVWVEWG